MYNKFLYYSVLFVIHGIIFSQSSNISGFVIDHDTKATLQNVNIFVPNINIGTTTDTLGYFILETPIVFAKDTKINFKMIGYEEKILPASFFFKNLDTINTISLKKKPIEIKPIEIYSIENNKKQISDIIISGYELQENLKTNIASTLSNYPNIGINSFGSVTSKPAIRGFSGDRFLITIDGIETGDLSQSSIDHAIALDMTEVNKIEIIRGPKSLLFGPNAIGGVINTNLLSHPERKYNRIQQRYLIGRESYNNGYYGNLMLYIPFNSRQINIFLSKKFTENESTPIGLLNNTQSSSHNYKIGFTEYLKNSYINFSAERFNLNYGIPPTSIGHINGVDILLLKDSYQVNFQKNISYLGFNTIDIKYNNIDYVHVELVNNEKFNNNISQIIDSSSYHVSLAKKTQNLKLLLTSNNSTFGIEKNQKQFKPEGFYLTPVTNEIQYSIYGFIKKELTSYNLNILSSFRLGYLSIKPGEYILNNRNANLVLKDIEGNILLDQNGERISLVTDRIFNNLSFSFGINKEFNNIKLNSWIMHTMRPPMVEELYSDGPHLASYAFEIGNPNLEAERIWGLENSIYFNINSLNFSLIHFYNYSPYYFQMTKDGHCEVPDDWKPWTTHPCYGVDWIDWGSGGLGWLHKYSSKGSEAIIQGYEFDVNYKIKSFKLNYNVSYVQGDDKTLQLPLSYMTPMKQIVNFSYKNNLSNFKIKFSKIHAQNRLGEFETETLGSLLTDIILSFNYKKQTITFQFNNIFDVTYYNHLSRIKNISPESGKNVHIIYKLFI